MLRQLSSILNTVVDTVVPKNVEERRADLYRGLIRREAKIGGELFGPAAPGVHREFFCLDKNTVVYHEESTKDGKVQIKTIRYDIRPSGVLKTSNGQHYQSVSNEEATRLLRSVKAYKQRVHRELYPFVAA